MDHPLEDIKRNQRVGARPRKTTTGAKSSRLTEKAFQMLLAVRSEFFGDERRSTAECAGIARVPLSAVEGWLVQGRKMVAAEWKYCEETGEEWDIDALPPVARFALEWDHQDALGELHRIQLVKEASEKGPQYWMAVAWLLERRKPGSYAKVETQAVKEQRDVIVRFVEADGDDWQHGHIHQKPQPAIPAAFTPDEEEDL